MTMLDTTDFKYAAEVEKRLKDPKGGLTAEGRKAFGGNLKPGVKDYDAASDADKRRWISWARRFYGQANYPPLKDEQGNPTRFALTAAAWGEPVPTTEAAARAIAAKAVKRQAALDAQVAKARDGDKDGRIHDGTPQERPAPADIERMKRKGTNQRTLGTKVKRVEDSQRVIELRDALDRQKKQRSGRDLYTFREGLFAAMEERNLTPEQRKTAYETWIASLSQAERKNLVNFIDYKNKFERPRMAKARRVRDADGDGMVFDNTPRERPALPSERLPPGKKKQSRTARLIDRIQGRAGKKPAPKKQAAPKAHAAKKPGAKPAATPNEPTGVTERWKLKSGKVGAQVKAKDKDGKTVTFNVIGADPDDVRSEIESIRDEGYTIDGIDPPRRDIGETPSRTAQARQKAPRSAETATDAPTTPPEAPAAPQKPTPKATEDPGDALDARLTPKKGSNPKEAAQFHFEAGGSISTAPAQSDIMAAVRAMPDRFTIIETSGTESDTSIIIDKQKKSKKVSIPGGETDNEVYFVKRTTQVEGRDLIVHDDTSNEAMADSIFRQMGYTLPEVKTSGKHWDEDSFTIQQHVSQVLPPNKKTVKPASKKEENRIYAAMDGMSPDDSISDWADAMEQAAPNLMERLSVSSDPGGMLRVALSDFLIMNQDRNTGNFFLVHDEKNDDHTVLPIDNGFSFEGGLDTLFEATGTMDDFFVPQDMNEWLTLRDPSGNMAAMTMGLGVAAVGKDQTAVAAEIDRVVQQFEQVDIDAILKKMASQGATKDQLAVLRDSLRGMAARVRWMKQNRDQIAQEFTS